MRVARQPQTWTLLPAGSGGVSAKWTQIWTTGPAPTGGAALKGTATWGTSASASTPVGAPSTGSTAPQSTGIESSSPFMLPASASSTSTTDLSSFTPARRSHTGPIIGGIIAAIAAVLLLLALFWKWRRRVPADPCTNNSPKCVVPFDLNEGSAQDLDAVSTHPPADRIEENSSTPTQLLSAPQSTASSSEKGRIPVEAGSSSPYQDHSVHSWDVNLNEKHAAGPSHPHATPGSPSGSPLPSPPYPSSAHHLSFSLRPPSSVTPSDDVPAYVRDPTAMRGRHGMHHHSVTIDPTTSDLLDVPPCYEC
ncbi:hypothetical protein GALMADRAFT_247089 [Galerina marginata CBS 339.88]|uniref:Uncharacterized protein n=1 Tax=Galerina marginata (strain CBS 339.88) TaxID=685588 RepID=A0A067T0I8_GALM3|nr:hypothetical protein GALMADRAFT_247089 [Galerina marginata CBS 339.88]